MARVTAHTTEPEPQTVTTTDGTRTVPIPAATSDGTRALPPQPEPLVEPREERAKPTPAA
jgi:hypothetical protein